MPGAVGFGSAEACQAPDTRTRGALMDRDRPRIEGGAVARPLRGRNAEIDAIERLLADAAPALRAVSWSFVGDPGLEVRAARARGRARRRHAGPTMRRRPDEAALPFAGLLQILRRFSASIGRLPAPQPLPSAAFGSPADRIEDQFLISLPC